MSWAIRYDGYEDLVGSPEPFVYATRREALAKKNRVAHHVGFSLLVVEVNLPANSKEKVRRKK